MSSLPANIQTTLLEAGFAFKKRRKRWVGYDVSLKDSDIKKLELWELDQVLEGAKRGIREIRLGHNKTFEFG